MRIGNAKSTPVFRTKPESGGWSVYRVEFMPRFKEEFLQWFSREVDAEIAARTYGTVAQVDDDETRQVKIAKE